MNTSLSSRFLVQLLVGQMHKRQLVISHMSEVDQYRELSDATDPEGAGTEAERPSWGYRGGTGGRAGVVKVSMELCIKCAPTLTVLAYWNPHMQAHTRCCRVSWCTFPHHLPVLSVEPAGFWSDGVGKGMGGVNLVLSHHSYVHVITEARVLMSMPSLGRLQLLLMVQEIIGVQFIQL